MNATEADYATARRVLMDDHRLLSANRYTHSERAAYDMLNTAVDGARLGRLYDAALRASGAS